MKKQIVLILLSAIFYSAAGAAERPVTLKRDFGTLYGTLLTPDGGAETAVLIIAGSGPTDRNGNNPLGGGGNSYLYLAQELEKAGIASLRYDKRAIGTSRLDDPSRLPDLTFDDYIGDAAALADLLAAEGFEKVVLAGHSEGALIALCAAQHSEAVSAVITLAGPGYPMDEILQLQMARSLAPDHMDILMEANGIVAALKRGERVDMERHQLGLKSLFHPSVQAFLISELQYDPRREIAKLKVPVLIVNGDNDIQITADNADALHRARPEARKVIVPQMTHMLTQSEARTMEEQVKTVYSGPEAPFHPELTAVVTEFIRDL